MVPLQLWPSTCLTQYTCRATLKEELDQQDRRLKLGQHV
jgi:hypothetical protein